MTPNEKTDLKLFIELLGNIDELECEFQDKPDLRVPMQSLGIEHTRVKQYDPTIPRGRQKYPQEKLHWKLLQQAKEIFRRHSDLLLNLHAWFSEPFDLREGDIDHEAHVLAQSVLAAVSRHPSSGTEDVVIRSWQAQQFGLPFPKSLALYVYSRVESPGSELWGAGYGPMIPSLTIEEVEARIREKEDRLAEYRRQCHTIWLLMVIDTGLPSDWFEVPDALIQHRFPTQFDRLFLLSPFQRRLIELQVEHH